MIGSTEKTTMKKLFSVFIYATVFLATIVSGYICEQPVMGIVANVMTSVIGVFIFTGYFNRNDDDICMHSLKTFAVMFIISEILLVMQNVIFTGTLWLLVAVYAALYDKAVHAFASYGLLMLQYILLVVKEQKDIDLLIFMAVLGVAILIVFKQIESIKNIPYAFAVLMLLTLVMIIVYSQFDVKKIIDNIGNSIVLIICDIILVIVAVWKFVMVVLKDRAKKRHIIKLHNKLMEVIEADHTLIKAFHEYSGVLFMHSMKVSMISRDAVEYIEGDSLLAQAGGMFHEVGRMGNSKDFIKAGLSIGKKYGFPKELMDIIKQHGAGKEKPKTKEAAVVMLSDCIISTSEFLEKKGKRKDISDSKLVEGVFNNRIQKGSLDESGLTDEDIQKLKEYYISNAFDN